MTRYDRMHFANASNSRHRSIATQQQETEADDAANKALESMSSKERRHYIDSVLRVKVGCEGWYTIHCEHSPVLTLLCITRLSPFCFLCPIVSSLGLQRPHR